MRALNRLLGAAVSGQWPDFSRNRPRLAAAIRPGYLCIGGRTTGRVAPARCPLTGASTPAIVRHHRDQAPVPRQLFLPVWRQSGPPPTCPGGAGAVPWRRRDLPGNAGLVDVAIASVIRDGLLRVSETVALAWADVSPAPDGSGVATVRRSKD